MSDGFILDNINFTLNDGSLFFQNLSMTFQAGKIHCISGSNGAGKSTLFRVMQGKIKKGEQISGLLMLDSNTYVIHNNILSPNLSTHVKLLSQNIDSLLVGTMTVAENLRLSTLSNESFLKRFASDKSSHSLLSDVAIPSDQLVEKLSGGQRQLLAFVMGYRNAGSVFLLDEPTAALDQINTILLMDAIANLAKKKKIIIIMISHDHEIIKRYCTGNHYQIFVGNDRVRAFVQI